MSAHYIIQTTDGKYAVVLSGDDGQVSARQYDGLTARAPYGLAGVRYVLAHAETKHRDVSTLDVTDLCGIKAWRAPRAAEPTVVFGFEARGDGAWSSEACGAQDRSNYFDTLAEAEAQLPRLARTLGCDISEVRVVEVRL